MRNKPIAVHVAALCLGLLLPLAARAAGEPAFYGVGTPQAPPAGPAFFSDASASGRTLLGYEFLPEGIRSFVFDTRTAATTRLPGLSPDSRFEVLFGLGDDGRTAVGYGDRPGGRNGIAVGVPDGPATTLGTPVAGFDGRRFLDLSEDGTTLVGWDVPLDEQQAFYALRGAEDELLRVPFGRDNVVSSIATHVGDAGDAVIGEVLANGDSFAFRYRPGADRAEVFDFAAAGVEDVSVEAITGDARFVAGSGFSGREQRAVVMDLDEGTVRVLPDGPFGATGAGPGAHRRRLGRGRRDRHHGGRR